jgi:hypothetical protein
MGRTHPIRSVGWSNAYAATSNESYRTSPLLPPILEQVYRQGRSWFQDSKVGQFLDKLKNIARQPEFSRTSTRESIRLQISNASDRSRQILLARVKDTGITLMREDQAEFDVKFSGKSRIQSASLKVDAKANQPLMDLLQGRTNLEGIGGWATITQIEDDAGVLHHIELKPNKQTDRRGRQLQSIYIYIYRCSEVD